MDYLLWIGLSVLGTLIGLGILLSIIGLFLPKSHVASCRIDLRGVPRESVFAALTDLDAFPAWRRGLKSLERLPDRNGQAVWRETLRNGPMSFQRTVDRPPDTLQATIVDNRTITGGWDYQLDDLAEPASGTRLTITERGTLHNPLFVCMSKFFDLSATIHGFQEDLATHLGVADATPEPCDPPPPL